MCTQEHKWEIQQVPNLWRWSENSENHSFNSRISKDLSKAKHISPSLDLCSRTPSPERSGHGGAPHRHILCQTSFAHIWSLPHIGGCLLLHVYLSWGTKIMEHWGSSLTDWRSIIWPLLWIQPHPIPLRWGRNRRHLLPMKYECLDENSVCSSVGS